MTDIIQDTNAIGAVLKRASGLKDTWPQKAEPVRERPETLASYWAEWAKVSRPLRTASIILGDLGDEQEIQVRYVAPLKDGA